MNPRELEKLLGGYAAGTLTDAEQQALCEAALHDQALFDALVREQPLRDLLRDPASRERLLAALDPPPRRAWLWRPVAAALAMAAIGVVAVSIARRPRPVLVSRAVQPAVPAVSARPQPAPPALEAPVTQPPVAQGHGLRRAADGPVQQKQPRPQARVRLATPLAPAPPPPPAAPAPAALPVPAAAGNTFAAASAAPPAGVPGASLQGVVRDPTGAAIPDATVVAINKFTAESAQASTNPNGRYEFPSLHPGIYNLTAQARGFSPTAIKEVPVQAQAARDLILQVGSTSESVEVSAAAPLLAAAARRASSTALALRYSIFRRDAAGKFVDASLADLHPGDAVELRITAQQNGYLSIGGGPPVALTAMAPYTTPPLTGPAEVKIIFATQPQREAPLAVPAVANWQNGEFRVAARQPGQPLVFTVKLP